MKEMRVPEYTDVQVKTAGVSVALLDVYLSLFMLYPHISLSN